MLVLLCLSPLSKKQATPGKTQLTISPTNEHLLKLSLLYIISPLIYLCNKSLTSGIFPSWLKYSQVTPILKKGNKFELSNYRPVSLLTSFSKIFEKVIYKRLVNHASTHNILSKAQYGLRTNMSTDNVIYQLMNNILKALDNKQLVGGMFCDLSKVLIV